MRPGSATPGTDRIIVDINDKNIHSITEYLKKYQPINIRPLQNIQRIDMLCPEWDRHVLGRQHALA